MTDALAKDLLCGADAIAEFTGFTHRRVLYLCETKQLCVFKLGNRWCARKSELDRALSSAGNGEAA